MDWSYLKNISQKVSNGDLGTEPGVTSKVVTLTFGVPQFSVLGPILFTLYQTPLGSICMKHGVTYHLYADNQQMYLPYKPINKGSQEECISRLENCITKTSEWMTNNVLNLSEDKTKFILFSTQQQLQKVSNITIKVGTTKVKLVKSVRNLG